MKLFQYDCESSPTLYEPNCFASGVASMGQMKELPEFSFEGELSMDLENLIQSPKISTSSQQSHQISPLLLQQLSPIQQQHHQQNSHSSAAIGMYAGNVYNLNVQVLLIEFLYHQAF